MMFWRKPRDIEFGTPRKVAVIWEYRIEKVIDARTTPNYEKEIMEKLDQLGREGWELVSTEPTKNKIGENDLIIMFFKRPRA